MVHTACLQYAPPAWPIESPMMSSRSPLTRYVAMAAAWLVLLLVGLGLSRRLVVCNQPCCAGHVKFVASCDTRQVEAEGFRTGAKSGTGCCCCGGHRHDTHDGHGHDGDGERRAAAGATCHGCVHVALGVDLGLPPGGAFAIDAVAMPIGQAVMLPAWADATPVDVVHPPATGPPRCDRRTALLATTVLRL